MKRVCTYLCWCVCKVPGFYPVKCSREIAVCHLRSRNVKLILNWRHLSLAVLSLRHNGDSLLTSNHDQYSPVPVQRSWSAFNVLHSWHGFTTAALHCFTWQWHTFDVEGDCGLYSMWRVKGEVASVCYRLSELIRRIYTYLSFMHTVKIAKVSVASLYTILFALWCECVFRVSTQTGYQFITGQTYG